MNPSCDNSHILYQIAMSIGNSLDTAKMLRDSLSTFLKKLNCSAGGIHSLQPGGDGRICFKTEIAIPRSAPRLELYQEALRHVPQCSDAIDWKGISRSFPVQGQALSGKGHYCVLDLPRVGFMVLLCNSHQASCPLVHSLQPLLEKLAFALIACRQNEELASAQTALEKRVDERTLEIIEAYEKLKQAQSQLLQSEKLAGIGQLAAGVAHEINNPVGFIKSNLGTLGEYSSTLKNLLRNFNSLQEAVKQGKCITDSEVSTLVAELESVEREEDLAYILEDMDALIAESSDGAQRVKEIVQNLKSFARLDESEQKEADINEGIEATLKVVWNEVKYKAKVVKKLQPLPLIRCYPGQLNQVFMNLLVNAAQSIQGKGTITIETENRDSGINIRISDTGSGIPKENLSRLFDPFFTTKPVGKGTGLGLSISYGIIKKHNGTIEVESQPGRGTSFTITLPICEAES
ncbi:hypothetical protein LLH00_10320 [bacterium]|nr:hypothetical protein [bacterium]